MSTVVYDGTPTITSRTFDGNINLLHSINELADEVAPNIHHDDKNLTYTSYMTSKSSTLSVILTYCSFGQEFEKLF